MKLSEKGFVTPITLTIALLLFSFLYYQIEQYVIEKKFFQEQDEIVTIESLLQMGKVDLLTVLGAEQHEYKTGTLHYEKGIVTYTISPQDENLIIVSLQSLTNNQRKRTVIFHYDPILNEVIKWVET